MSTTEPQTEPEPLVTAEWVANRLAISPSSVRRYVDSERLPFVQLGGRRLRFRRADVERWIESRSCVIQKPGAAEAEKLVVHPTPTTKRDYRADARRILKGL